MPERLMTSEMHIMLEREAHTPVCHNIQKAKVLIYILYFLPFCV